MIKIDSIGSIIWSKEYGSAELGGGLLSVKELCDGNILALGQGNDGLGSPSPANGYPHGVLLKTNSEGDSLWYNIYEHCTELEAQNYLRHFTPTSDDGIVACGFVSPGAACGGTQDMWIIKLDGDGNETGFKPITSEKGLMSVYPNPATGKFSIKVTNINANHCISLYNQLGVKIKETKVMNELTTVNVSHLPNGIYFLQVGEETKKFVVSR